MKNATQYINPSTGAYTTPKNAADKKMMAACGWKRVKSPTQVFSNGSKTGNRFI